MTRLLTSLIALAVLAAAPAVENPEADLLERGRETYEIYCSSCHGADARGRGPLAEILEVAPSDLTTVSLRNGGEFPFDYLYLVVDGREAVVGHGSGDMPVWGMTFRERGLDRSQEDEVRGRILQLLMYVRSIQATSWSEDPGEGTDRRD